MTWKMYQTTTPTALPRPALKRTRRRALAAGSAGAVLGAAALAACGGPGAGGDAGAGRRPGPAQGRRDAGLLERPGRGLPGPDAALGRRLRREERGQGGGHRRRPGLRQQADRRLRRGRGAGRLPLPAGEHPLAGGRRAADAARPGLHAEARPLRPVRVPQGFGRALPLEGHPARAPPGLRIAAHLLQHRPVPAPGNPAAADGLERQDLDAAEVRRRLRSGGPRRRALRPLRAPRAAPVGLLRLHQRGQRGEARPGRRRHRIRPGREAGGGRPAADAGPDLQAPGGAGAGRGGRSGQPAAADAVRQAGDADHQSGDAGGVPARRGERVRRRGLPHRRRPSGGGSAAAPVGASPGSPSCRRRPGPSCSTSRASRRSWTRWPSARPRPRAPRWSRARSSSIPPGRRRAPGCSPTDRSTSCAIRWPPAGRTWSGTWSPR